MAKETYIPLYIDQLRNFDNGTRAWSTPNTYAANFKIPPASPGVYFFLAFRDIYDHNDTGEIIYIGSSGNLALRKDHHEVLRIVKRHYQYIQFWFKEIYEGYIDVEKALITEFKPKYNTQHVNG